MLSSVEVDAVLNEILATPDVGEIFVRVFRWAQRKKRYVLNMHHTLTATARDYPQWLDARKVFAGMLRNGAQGRMRAHPDPERRTWLPDDIAVWLRRELRKRLMVAEDKHVFPILLGLMDAIDREAHELLWADFLRRGAGLDMTAVHGSRPFPKPVPALSPPDLSYGPRQSERGELPEYLELEQYFGWLSVSTRSDCILDRGLHPRSERGSGARPWRVAVLSVLSDVGELDWQKPEAAADRRFWTSGFSSPAARDAVRGRLLRAMKLCADYRADLILIPELNIDAEIQELLLELLGKMRRGPGSLHPMVIGGCLHEPAPGEDTAYCNRPAVLTPGGALSWIYHKVAAADWDGRKEALGEQPPAMVAIDTPMGRIAIAMCLDFLTNAVVESIVDLRASVVVVLSMTSPGSVNLFQAKAGELAASTHAITLFCNSSLLMRPPGRGEHGPWTLGFAYPHTKGTPRPLCEHELDDPATVATVAIYELEYCSRRGVTGKVLLNEAVPAISVSGQVLSLPSVIDGGGAHAPVVGMDAFPDLPADLLDGEERSAAD